MTARMLALLSAAFGHACRCWCRASKEAAAACLRMPHGWRIFRSNFLFFWLTEERAGEMDGKRGLEECEEGEGRCSKVLRLNASPGLQPCALRKLE